MPTEINRIFSARTAGALPYFALNLANSALDQWTNFNNGNGAATVISGTDNNTVTAEITAGAVGRSYRTVAFAVVSGNTYLFYARLTVNSGTPTTVNMSINNDPGITKTPGNLTCTTSGWYGISFVCNTTGSVDFRLGLGVNSNEQPGINVSWDSVQCHEWNGSTDVPDIAHGFYDDGTDSGEAGAQLGAEAYMWDFSGNAWNNSTGAITFAVGSPFVFSRAKRHCIGVFTGDSYSNGNNDVVARLVRADGHMVMYGRAGSGQHMGTQAAAFANVCNLAGKNHDGIRPTFALILSSINSVNTGTETLDDELGDIVTMINAAVAEGLYPIVTNMISVSIVNTAAEFDKTYQYNAELKGLCDAKGAWYCDVESALADPDNPGVPRAAYADGDGVHLTTGDGGGYDVMARKILSDLNRIRASSSTSRGIIGSMIGSI